MREELLSEPCRGCVGSHLYRQDNEMASADCKVTQPDFMRDDKACYYSHKLSERKAPGHQEEKCEEQTLRFSTPESKTHSGKSGWPLFAPAST